MCIGTRKCIKGLNEDLRRWKKKYDEVQRLMDRYQHDPSVKDDTDSEHEEIKPEATELTKLVADKTEDDK